MQTPKAEFDNPRRVFGSAFIRRCHGRLLGKRVPEWGKRLP
jgi:hypothetical protein